MTAGSHLEALLTLGFSVVGIGIAAIVVAIVGAFVVGYLADRATDKALGNWGEDRDGRR